MCEINLHDYYLGTHKSSYRTSRFLKTRFLLCGDDVLTLTVTIWLTLNTFCDVCGCFLHCPKMKGANYISKAPFTTTVHDMPSCPVFSIREKESLFYTAFTD